jgi:hypothetical protein
MARKKAAGPVSYTLMMNPGSKLSDELPDSWFRECRFFLLGVRMESWLRVDPTSAHPKYLNVTPRVPPSKVFSTYNLSQIEDAARTHASQSKSVGPAFLSNWS